MPPPPRLPVWRTGESTRDYASLAPGAPAFTPLRNLNRIPREGFSLAASDRGEVTAAFLPPGEIKTPGRSGMRSGVLAVAAADGTTLVAWKHQGVLGWQLYDAKGEPLGTPDSAPSSGSGAAGVVLRDGRFVLFP